MIDWTQVIISICALVITGILIPLVKALIEKVKVDIEINVDDESRKLIYEIVETGVRWAKQWLQSETGEKKKEAVFQYASNKLSELHIEVSADDLNKIIECIYEQVKKEGNEMPSVK